MGGRGGEGRGREVSVGESRNMNLQRNGTDPIKHEGANRDSRTTPSLPPPLTTLSPTHTAAPTLNRAFRHASPVQGLDKVLPLTLEHVQAAYAMGCWGKSMRYSNGLLNLRQVGSPAKGYRRISVKIQGFLDIRFLRDEFSRQGLPKVAKF